MKKLRKKTKKKLFIGGIASIALIGGTFGFLYSQKDFKETNKPKDETPPIVEPEETPVTIVDLNSKTRPYAVMINNISTARPYHSGLQDAYITYEIIVEGGITRYLALFKDTDTQKIGSVRSSRHYYLDYVLENDAIYTHWGGSPFAYDDLSKLNIDNIDGYNYDGKYFYRENLPVSSEHTGYTTMDKLKKGTEALKYRTDLNKDLLLNYDGDEVIYEESIDACNVAVKFSKSINSTFVYDTENKYYLMSINGKEHKDYVTKDVYHYKNLIVYNVKNTTISGDDKGRQNLSNTGSGEGYYISNGKAIEITWEKTSRDSQTIYKIKSTSEELVVNDGNTYIGLMPITESISIS